MSEFHFRPENFTTIPAGRYRSIIESLEEKDSQAGNKMLVCGFRISVAGKPKLIRGYYMLQGKGLRKTESFLRVFYPERIPDRLTTEAFLNKECEIDLMYDPKSEGNRPYPRVTAVYPMVVAGSSLAITNDFKPSNDGADFNEFEMDRIIPGEPA